MSTAVVSSVRSTLLEQDFEQMFREHSPMLYRTAYSILRNEADAEDVLQTIFFRLLRRKVPADVHRNVKGYLYRAAINQSLNIVRMRQRQELIANAKRFEVPVEAVDSDSAEEMDKRLAEAIAELHPEAAHILILRYIHSYSDVDIAKLLGTSRGTIAVRLFRSRARLKKLMRDSLGEK
jgi:RNA polymerase sigma-70 factor (ECF subfamily)